mmetsp:Transcript_17678/g.35470  ORF Transcript_17678/g.35470 Transcript_17678/m.35470 type:complete len:202 (-) Transcript_17678:330-935(-)
MRCWILPHIKLQFILRSQVSLQCPVTEPTTTLLYSMSICGWCPFISRIRISVKLLPNFLTEPHAPAVTTLLTTCRLPSRWEHSTSPIRTMRSSPLTLYSLGKAISLSRPLCSRRAPRGKMIRSLTRAQSLLVSVRPALQMLRCAKTLRTSLTSLLSSTSLLASSGCQILQKRCPKMCLSRSWSLLSTTLCPRMGRAMTQSK